MKKILFFLLLWCTARSQSFEKFNPYSDANMQLVVADIIYEDMGKHSFVKDKLTGENIPIQSDMQAFQYGILNYTTLYLVRVNKNLLYSIGIKDSFSLTTEEKFKVVYVLMKTNGIISIIDSEVKSVEQVPNNENADVQKHTMKNGTVLLFRNLIYLTSFTPPDLRPINLYWEDEVSPYKYIKPKSKK